MGQIQKINQSIGVCRWLYNGYLAKNKDLYQMYKDGFIDKKESFMSANDFDKFVNNKLKTLDQYRWINECGSKARKKAICNAEAAFKNFFKGLSDFPRFKKKGKSNVSLYFPKNNKTDWKIERHRVNVPTLKWVQLKEFGYIPTNAKVVSGTVTEKNGRYYKNLAICSNGMIFKNINKTNRIRKIEKKLKREQRKLSRKYEVNKVKIKKGEATRKNINKQRLKVARLHERLTNIRTDYINKTVSTIIQQKPRWITVENLNVKDMMKNKHLSKAIAQQKFYEFKLKLINKCNENNIELRQVDRFYPSSKTCSCCGSIKNDLNLSDRIYSCKACGLVMDRDLNASINLRNAKTYNIA